MAVQRMAELAPTDELRAKFRLTPPSLLPVKSAGEQWAHIAVEVIFERAPQAIQAKLMDILEEWAGKYCAPPSPMKPVASGRIRASISALKKK